MFSKFYRFSLFGLSESGKTCYLAALSSDKQPHPKEYVCDQLPAKAEVLQSLGIDPLKRKSLEISHSAIQHHSTRQKIDTYYSMTSKTTGKVYLELADYAGDLLSVDDPQDENDKSLRNEILSSEGILFLIETPRTHPTQEDVVRYEDYRNAFNKFLAHQLKDVKIRIPIAILFTKWDRQSPNLNQTIDLTNTKISQNELKKHDQKTAIIDLKKTDIIELAQTDFSDLKSAPLSKKTNPKSDFIDLENEKLKRYLNKKDFQNEHERSILSHINHIINEISNLVIKIEMKPEIKLYEIFTVSSFAQIDSFEGNENIKQAPTKNDQLYGFGLEDPLVWLVDHKNLLDLSSFLTDDNIDLKEAKKFLDRFRQQENHENMNFLIDLLEKKVQKSKKSTSIKKILFSVLIIISIFIGTFHQAIKENINQILGTYQLNHEYMITKCKGFILDHQILSCYENYKSHLADFKKLDANFDFDQLFKIHVNDELNKYYKEMDCKSIDSKFKTIQSDAYLSSLVIDLKIIENLAKLCVEKKNYTDFYQKRDLSSAQTYINLYGNVGRYYESVHCWLSLANKKCDLNHHPPKVSLNFAVNEMSLLNHQAQKMSLKVELDQNEKNLRAFEKSFELKKNESLLLALNEKIEINLNEKQQLKILLSYKNWFFLSKKLPSLSYDFNCQSLIEYIGKGKILKNDLIKEEKDKLDLQIQFDYQVDLKEENSCHLTEWLIESPLKEKLSKEKPLESIKTH